MENRPVNHPHLTAIRRTQLSVPVRYLLEHHLLQGRILDFGCGLGYDTDELCRQGFEVVGYDPYYRPEFPVGKFDTILCVYVLYVLEPYDQAEALMQVTHLLKPSGIAYFAVRRDLTHEGFRMHAVHHAYTFQCNVRLPFESLISNQSFELYAYRPYNRVEQVASAIRCPFCQLSQQVELICESATCAAFYDGYPVSPGHALIIPKRHVANYFDLTPREREAMNVMLTFVKRVVDERFHPDGYNVGINVNEAAGQSVFHVHMHLIPRYKGDVERPKGGVRAVIPGKANYDARSIHDSKEVHPKKAYTVHDKQMENGNAYLPWCKEADDLLCRLFDEGDTVQLLAEKFERAPGAIRSRLKKLGKLPD